MDPGDVDGHWRMYEWTLGEARGQVDRGWAHTQFFVLLSAGITGAALALDGAGGDAVLAAMTVLAGAGLAVIGMFVLRENKRYYRVLSVKRAALERHLGLHENIPGSSAIYALSVTADQAKLERMLSDPGSYIKPRLRWGSVSGWARWVLCALAIFDVAAALRLLV